MLKLERTSHRGGKTTHEVQYAITSLPPERADAQRLLAIWRGHWGIENREHWVRDTAFGEDRCRVRAPTAGHVLATLRNGVINTLRLQNTPNLTASLREHAYQPLTLFARLGIVNKE